MKTIRSFGFALFAVLLTAAIIVPAARAQRTSPVERSARDARTAAQRKIEPRLLYEVYRRRGEMTPAVPPASNRTAVHVDRHGRALVDVRVQPRPDLQKKIRALGGVVVSTSQTRDSIVSWMPLLTLERLAADPGVRAIEPTQ